MMKFEKIGNDWDNVIGEEFVKPYFKNLQNFLDEEYANKNIFPKREDVFNAFRLTSFAKTSVVIIGQDPYPTFGQAQGLAFSVPKGKGLPKALENIFKEIAGNNWRKQDPCLNRWAEQGVLLLNTVLTVREGKDDKKRNHRGKGWERFTDTVIKKLLKRDTPIIFMLWGKEAQKKEKLIREQEDSVHSNLIFDWAKDVPTEFVQKLPNAIKNHIILKSPHPVAVPNPEKGLKGFVGCGHFDVANKIIEKYGLLDKKIAW